MSSLPRRCARGVAAWLLRGATRLQAVSAAVYVGIAAFVGVDLFALIITSAAIWPIGIPLLLVAITLAYYTRRAWRRRSAGRDHV